MLTLQDLQSSVQHTFTSQRCLQPVVLPHLHPLAHSHYLTQCHRAPGQAPGAHCLVCRASSTDGASSSGEVTGIICP